MIVNMESFDFEKMNSNNCIYDELFKWLFRKRMEN